MTPPKFSFFLTFLFLGRIAHMRTLALPSFLHQESGLKTANVRDDVTLRCSYEDDVAVKFSWYKQPLGQKPQLVSSFYKYDENVTFHDEFKDNPRFKSQPENGEIHLKISDLHLSDSATYYCSKTNSYAFQFGEGVILNVEGSGSKVRALVYQPASETIQPGRSVNLNCTVHTGTYNGNHSIYWFRSSGESHPGIIYTHGVRNDQSERKPETQTQSCVYNLPMKSLHASDAGTYYCAVVSCGEILFGKGTKMDTASGVDSSVLVYLLSVALVFTTLLVVILAFSVCKMYKQSCCQCTDSQPRSSAASAPNVEGQDADDLHYAALRENKATRSRRQRDNTQSDCVYSSIRQ